MATSSRMTPRPKAQIISNWSIESIEHLWDVVKQETRPQIPRLWVDEDVDGALSIAICATIPWYFADLETEALQTATSRDLGLPRIIGTMQRHLFHQELSIFQFMVGCKNPKWEIILERNLRECVGIPIRRVHHHEHGALCASKQNVETVSQELTRKPLCWFSCGC